MKELDISLNEKELLLELERILVNHRYKCANVEVINSSNSTYMYRIKKALQKSKSERKRIEVLNKVIYSINTKINRGMLFKEIFEPLPTIIIDELKNQSKNQSKNESTNNESVNNDQITTEDKEKKRLAKIIFLSDVIDEILLRLENSDRKDLLKLEDEYKSYLKANTSKYNIVKASGEIIGSLNTGMIDSTRKNLEKTLYNGYRIKLRSTDKLSDKMSDELLKYRVAALIYTNIMCSKRIKKIIPSLDKKPNFKEYEGLKKDVFFLGNVVKEKYIDEYSISPKEEIIENSIGGQLTFEGLMTKRDAITRKRD